MDSELTINGLNEGFFDDIECNNITVNNNITVVGNQVLSGNVLISGTLGVGGAINTNTGYRINNLPLTADDIPEGITNFYFTDTKARLAISGGVGISYNNLNGVISLSANTDNIVEANNLYYSDTRSRAAISAATGIAYNNTSGVISLSANTSLVPETPSALYFTTARARQAYVGIAPIVVDSTGGAIYWNGTTSDVPEGLELYFTEARARTATNIDLNTPKTTVIGGTSDYNLNIKGGITAGITSRLRLLDGATGGHSLANNATNQRMEFFSFYPDGTPRIKMSYGTGDVSTETNINLISKGNINSLGGYQLNGVTLNADNIPEGVTNKYFTNSLARQAITVVSTTGLSATYDNNTGVITIPNNYLTPIGTKLVLASGFATLEATNLRAVDAFIDNTLYTTGIYNNGGQIGLGDAFFSQVLQVNVGGTFNSNGVSNFGQQINANSNIFVGGSSTFNNSISISGRVQILPNDPGKMIFKAYNTTNDVYGFGQYANSNNRIFTASLNDSWARSNNLSVLIDDSTNNFIDQLRTNSGKVGILNYGEGFTLTSDVTSTIATFMLTGPQLSTSNLVAGLRSQTVVKKDAALSIRTFETETRNVGRLNITGNFEENRWVQSVNYLTGGGMTSFQGYQTFMTTRCNPSEDLNLNATFGPDIVPQFYISQFKSGVGARTLMRLLFEQSDIPGVGGNNGSNVLFPRLARNVFVNCFVSPYGHLYPDIFASDINLKTNIQPQSSPILEEFKKINVVNFNWDYTGKHNDFFRQNARCLTDEQQIGVIAQNLEDLPTIKKHYKIVDVYKFSKELPSGNNETPWRNSNFKPEKEFLILNKERLPFLNMKAIQELAQNVEELGGVDLEALKAENNTLKQRVTTLENLLDGLILKLKKAFVI